MPKCSHCNRNFEVTSACPRCDQGFCSAHLDYEIHKCNVDKHGSQMTITKVKKTFKKPSLKRHKKKILVLSVIGLLLGSYSMGYIKIPPFPPLPTLPPIPTISPPSSNFCSATTSLDKLLPEGGKHSGVTDAEYSIMLKFPVSPIPDERYKVEYPDKTKIYLFQLRSKDVADDFVRDHLKIIEGSDYRYSLSTISKGSKQIKVYHKFASQSYQGTLLQKCIYVYYFDFPYHSELESEKHIKNELGYLFS